MIYAETVGGVFCIIGGILLVTIVLSAMLFFAVYLWEKASNEFRAICKAESLIFEYKKERAEYFKWKKAKEEQS